MDEFAADINESLIVVVLALIGQSHFVFSFPAAKHRG